MFPKKLQSQVICEPDWPVADTQEGKLRGLQTEGTYIFRGIPYARAERFHMPQPVEPWEGIQNALAYRPVCMEERTGVPQDQYFVPHFYNMQSEDCQYMNIWTQHLGDGAKRPVMLWIHGGLFTTGSSVEVYSYDGEELSRRGDVVVVSVNHRLNILGFLDLSAYGEEYAFSGNAGFADLVEALRWIRRNIAAFGGDPDNVTLFGQSGGGQKIAGLLQTPAADGLYHRAIIQSGMSAAGHRPGYGKMRTERGSAANHNTQEDARILAARVLENLKIKPENVKEIESVYYYELARAGMFAIRQCADENLIVGWGPTMDGVYYMGDAMAVGFREETADIPIIIGSNFGEFSSSAYGPTVTQPVSAWSQEETMEKLNQRFGDRTDMLIPLYQKAYPERPLGELLYLDNEFRKGVLDFAVRRARGGSRVYTYLFNLQMPYQCGCTPWHNCEEAFVFHNARYVEASYEPGVTEQMQDVMADAWLSFAAKGNPGHPGLSVRWEPYTPEGEEVLIFDREISLAHGHDTALIRAIPDRPMQKREWNGTVGGGPRLTF